MGTCGQFDGCAIGVRTRRIGRTYIAIGSIYRLSAPGPPLPIAKSGIGLAYSRGTYSHGPHAPEWCLRKNSGEKCAQTTLVYFFPSAPSVTARQPAVTSGFWCLLRTCKSAGRRSQRGCRRRKGVSKRSPAEERFGWRELHYQVQKRRTNSARKSTRVAGGSPLSIN